MMTLKDKGDVAELSVLADLAQRGFKVAIPFGDNWYYDLLLCRYDRFERVQVKYTESDGQYVDVRSYSVSVTNGKTGQRKLYDRSMIDWIAVYDKTTRRCYYIPVVEVEGKTQLRLRLTPTRNGQSKGVLWAQDYLDI